MSRPKFLAWHYLDNVNSVEYRIDQISNRLWAFSVRFPDGNWFVGEETTDTAAKEAAKSIARSKYPLLPLPRWDDVTDQVNDESWERSQRERGHPGFDHLPSVKAKREKDEDLK